jgi:outer membrane immunogenic protein
MMQKILLTATMIVSVVSGSALAADMPQPGPAPVYTKAPMIMPMYSWTGCYVGGNIGGVWATTNWTVAANGQAITNQNISSFLGGGQVGCNYQISTWVFGVQGDYDWTNANTATADMASVILRTDQTNIKSVASVTARAGYAWDRFLGYVKGGGAWDKNNYSVTTNATGATFSTASETRTGWTIGVGGEYGFTDWLTGFAEYDYYDFGTKMNTFTTIAAMPQVANIKQTQSVAKAGFNFKFGGWH